MLTFVRPPQALCPDALNCESMGVRSVIAPTLNAIVFAVKNLAEVVKSIGYIVIRYLQNFDFFLKIH